MGFFGRIKRGYAKAKGYVEKQKYASYMDKEAKHNEQRSQAEKDRARYAALAKAERARTQYERARAATARAQQSRSGMSGGMFGGGFGAASPGKNPLLNFGQEPRRRTGTMRKQSAQKYTIIKGKAYPLAGASRKKGKRTVRRERSIFDRMEDLM